MKLFLCVSQTVLNIYARVSGIFFNPLFSFSEDNSDSFYYLYNLFDGKNSAIFIGLVLSLLLIFVSIIRKIYRRLYLNFTRSSLSRLSGVKFEKYLSNLFSDDGFYVKSIGGKGDFGVDLLVKKDGITTAVQAKRYTKNVSLPAVQEVYAGKTYYGADRAIVITTSKYTKACKELARACEVQLIDGNELEKRIDRLKNGGHFL